MKNCILLAILFLLIANNLVGQDSKNFNIILNRGQNFFYSNQSQLMMVEINRSDASDVEIKISDGVLQLLWEDLAKNRMYQISNLKKGKVIIDVSTIKGGIKVFLFEKSFWVTDKKLTVAEEEYKNLNPLPYINLCGKVNGAISIDSFKLAKTLNVLKPYQLTSATIYFTGAGDSKVATLSGNSFEVLKQLIQKCTKGTKVNFENIKIAANNRTFSAPPMSFILE